MTSYKMAICSLKLAPNRFVCSFALGFANAASVWFSKDR